MFASYSIFKTPWLPGRLSAFTPEKDNRKRNGSIRRICPTDSRLLRGARVPSRNETDDAAGPIHTRELDIHRYTPRRAVGGAAEPTLAELPPTAIVDGRFVLLRVAYPLGLFSENGRVDHIRQPG
jgi:hypothetical protein